MVKIAPVPGEATMMKLVIKNSGLMATSLRMPHR
jgi:hypothetical protein